MYTIETVMKHLKTGRPFCVLGLSIQEEEEIVTNYLDKNGLIVRLSELPGFTDSNHAYYIVLKEFSYLQKCGFSNENGGILP